MMTNLTVPGLEVAWVTDTGGVRERNEDSIGVAPLRDNSGLFVVLSDGMGGQAAGEVASQIVRDRLLRSVEVLSPRHPMGQWYGAIRDALADADRLVREATGDDLHLHGMGATAVVAAVTPTAALHLYVGDSRLYHFRAGKRLYRTQDHSVVEVLRRVGQIQESDMQSHPQRNVLLSFVGGGGQKAQFEIGPKWHDGVPQQEAELVLALGDTLILCTDGLNGLVGEESLATMLSDAGQRPAAEVATRLMDAALGAGGTDNVTVAVVRVGE